MTILLQGWQYHPLQVPTKHPHLALPFVYSKVISHAEEIENCTAGNEKKKTLASATEVHTCVSDNQQFHCAPHSARVGTREDQIWRLVPTPLHAVGSILEMLQGLKSCFCSHKQELFFKISGESYLHFEESSLLRCYATNVNVSMMKALKSLTKSANIHESTWHNIPLDPTCQRHYCDSLKSPLEVCLWPTALLY